MIKFKIFISVSEEESMKTLVVLLLSLVSVFGQTPYLAAKIQIVQLLPDEKVCSKNAAPVAFDYLREFTQGFVAAMARYEDKIAHRWRIEVKFTCRRNHAEHVVSVKGVSGSIALTFPETRLQMKYKTDDLPKKAKRLAGDYARSLFAAIEAAEALGAADNDHLRTRI